MSNVRNKAFRYNSLRKRLVLPFSLLGLLVSSLLSSIAYVLVADIEETAIERILRIEMESFQNRKAINPGALPPSATLIHGDFLPSTELPGVLASDSPAGGFERRRIAGIHYSIYISQIGGRPYALLYDRSISESGLKDLRWALVVGVMLMSGLSSLVGHLLAGQVVKPIRRLLDDISEKSARLDPTLLLPLSFSASQYPDNEIGLLVKALEQFAQRLHGFVERESYFSSDVSHELRTPVAVIRGAVEVLIDSPEPSESVRMRLLTIQRQALRMSEILEAMLLLARESGQAGDPACALADVVEEVIADCTPWHNGTPLQTRFERQARPIVPVERSLAYVVLSNLMRNAWAHSRDDVITVTLTDQQIEIRDAGVGIPMELQSRIFSRHAKGASSVGEGLGLSIVARIVEMVGWRITVESTHGFGTSVKLAFATGDARVIRQV